MKVFMLHDMVVPNDPKGRSYKEINEAKPHRYSIGALVEIRESGVRLFVVYRTRDCDGTPLYSLAVDKGDVVRENLPLGNPGWHNGFDESGLKLIKKRS